MVDYMDVSEPQGRLDAVYDALSDATRRAIVERLARFGAQKISDLARPFHITKQAITKHIKVLERAGLLRREIRGREHHCALEAGPMHDAATWLEQNRKQWEARLDSLGAYLAQIQHEEPPDTPPDAPQAKKESL